MMVFFRTRLKKILIWQKFSKTSESGFKLRVKTFRHIFKSKLKHFVIKKLKSIFSPLCHASKILSKLLSENNTTVDSYNIKPIF